MEGVAHREAEREELHKELAGVELRLLQRRQQVRDVEQQQKQASESARSEADELTAKRRHLLEQIEQVIQHPSVHSSLVLTVACQEKSKLIALQKTLEELCGFDSNGLETSDTEEVDTNVKWND